MFQWKTTFPQRPTPPTVAQQEEDIFESSIAVNLALPQFEDKSGTASDNTIPTKLEEMKDLLTHYNRLKETFPCLQESLQNLKKTETCLKEMSANVRQRAIDHTITCETPKAN